jgi:hypothetical protein
MIRQLVVVTHCYGLGGAGYTPRVRRDGEVTGLLREAGKLAVSVGDVGVAHERLELSPESADLVYDPGRPDVEGALGNVAGGRDGGWCVASNSVQ